MIIFIIITADLCLNNRFSLKGLPAANAKPLMKAVLLSSCDETKSILSASYCLSIWGLTCQLENVPIKYLIIFMMDHFNE